MIYETPQISGGVEAKLETLKDLRLRMSQRLNREMPWDQPLRRFVKGDAYASSTRIEGYRVEDSRRQALASDQAESTPRNDNEEALACYAQAMDHVATLANDPEFRWDKRVLLDLHFEACRFQKDKRPGLIREGSIRVTAPEGGTAYTAPPAHQVSELLGELVTSLEESTGSIDPAVEAAKRIAAYLEAEKLKNPGGGTLEFYVSDRPEAFELFAEANLNDIPHSGHHTCTQVDIDQY